MKKIILTLLLCISAINLMAENASLYLPQQGGYKKSDMNIVGVSLNDICGLLKYNHEKYIWISDGFETKICFKMLSTEILYIVTTQFKDDFISEETVSTYLKDNKFDYDFTYSVKTREEQLDEGIENHSLSIDFIESVTKTKVSNNTIEDKFNGYIYTFGKDGYMVSYASSDGLIGYAKEYKGTALFNRIKAIAEQYNYTRGAVIDEINMQFDYFSKINIDYLSLAKTEKYGYNYALLYVDLNKPDIQMDDFMKIVHHKADVFKVTPNETILKYNYNFYTFDSEKRLVAIE